MKKLIAIALVLVMALSLVACGEKANNHDQSQQQCNQLFHF